MTLYLATEAALLSIAGKCGIRVDNDSSKLFSNDVARAIEAFVLARELGHTLEQQLISRLRSRHLGRRKQVFENSDMRASNTEESPGSNRVRAAREETVRILDGLATLVGDICQVKGLLREPQLSGQRSLDSTSAPRLQQILTQECRKVERLEAVLAVIGTVKAGKSTVINAIVGLDLLPNRPLPMTTYPTFIRHDPSKDEPELSLPLAPDFTRLIRELRGALTREPLRADIDADAALKALAQRITTGELDSLELHVSGRHAISRTLEIVNDLTRLSERLGYETPSRDDTSLDMFPSITVRFSHLKNLDVTGVGVLSLLDTPGPNEHGIGEKLRKIVRERIEETSAVVLVADFTQLNVEAGAELQQVLSDTLHGVHDRTHVFVNKYDMARAHDWDRTETKSHVSRMLLDGTIPPDRVYPLSGLGAFLANAAHRWLENETHLPDESWTVDFLRKFAGINGERLRDDRAAAMDIARMGWQESGLDEPLDKVIAHAARNAAFVCLDAALHKAATNARLVETFLGARETAFTRTAAELKGQIASLADDIRNVEAARGRVESEVETQFGKVSADIDNLCDEMRKQLLAAIETFFASQSIKITPQRLEELNKRLSEEAKKAGKTSSSSRKAGFKVHGKGGADEFVEVGPEYHTRPFLLALQQLTNETPTDVLLSNEHSSRAAAEEQIALVRSRVATILDTAERALTNEISELSSNLETSLHQETMVQIEDILATARERLQRELNVSLSFPPITLVGTASPKFQILGASALSTKTVQDTRLEKRDTTTAKVKRFFGGIFEKIGLSSGEWGYDRITTTRDVHRVDFGKIRDEVLIGVGSFGGVIQTRVKNHVEKPVRESIRDYFDAIETYLTGVRHDLGDALDDKGLEVRELERLYGEIVDLKRTTMSLLEDALASAEGIAAWG